MNRKELLIYNTAQMIEMQRHKWIMSEEQERDVGDEAVLDWITNHSARFREEWCHENGISGSL